MLAKDLLLTIANEMGKHQSTFQKYINELDSQMFENSEDLREVSDEQWKQMDFPLGLVNKIRQKLLIKPFLDNQNLKSTTHLLLSSI
jgi:hypothetical protein